MTKIKIIYKPHSCVSCGSCSIVAPKFFALDDSNHPYLINGVLNSEGNFEVIVDSEQEDVDALNTIKESCPGVGIDLEIQNGL